MYSVVYRFKFVVRRGIFIAFHCSNDPCTLYAKAFGILFGHFGLTKIKGWTKTTISFYLPVFINAGGYFVCVHNAIEISWVYSHLDSLFGLCKSPMLRVA
jgi:hypothetical protein